MNKIFDKFLSKKEDDSFLVVEAGLESLTVASFKLSDQNGVTIPKLLGVNRKKNFNEDDFAALATDSLKTLEGIVGPLPKKVLLGVSGSGTKTATVVARVQRSDATKPVSEDEVKEILERSAESQTPHQDGNYKLFFSSVVWANIDGAKITNPVGNKGSEMEVSCFHAYKKVEELERWDKYLTDSTFEISKILPTAFAVSKIIIRNGIQSLILLRVSENKTEVSFITETNIAEVSSFDLGYEQMDLWPSAISILFTEISLPKGLPDVIWIYPEGTEHMGEKIRTALSEINWKTDFKREIPNIRLGQKPEGYEVQDTPLIALSMEGVTSGLS